MVKARVKGRAGMSLVEIMIAIAIVSLTLLAMLSLITSSARVQDDSSQRTLAYNVARQKVEEIRSGNFHEILTTYNSLSTQKTFKVDGLPAGPFTLSDGTAGAQGKISFPEDKDGSGYLSEDPVDAVLREEFGMPKDLNRNGNTTDTGVYPKATDPLKLIPVKVEVQWVVPSGKYSTVKIVTFITER